MLCSLTVDFFEGKNQSCPISLAGHGSGPWADSWGDGEGEGEEEPGSDMDMDLRCCW